MLNEKIKSLDWFLFIALLGIVLFGITALYSIGLGRGDEAYMQRQLVAFGIGSIGMLAIAFANYRLIKNTAIPLYVFSCVLLLAVLLFGEKVRGTRGWFMVGDVGFQPAEFAKIALIIMLARYFSLWTKQNARLRPLFVSMLITAVPGTLVLLQPDFGSALILFALWLSMVLARGIPRRYAICLAVAAIALLFVSWMYLFQDYQKERVLSFLSPGRDSGGAGYNVRQALIAIGSGQLFGQGVGEGSQSQLRFLPEAQTDFIFAVIAEEMGFVGVVALLLFWLLLFERLTRTLRASRDDFSLFTVFGVIVVFFVQLAVTVGGNLGLLPITGLVLPFVSYGGSALVMFFLMIGLTQSVRIHSRG